MSPRLSTPAVLIADLALLGGLAYVMARAPKLLHAATRRAAGRHETPGPAQGGCGAIRGARTVRDLSASY